MSTRRDNPHFPGTPEHLMWERYQAAYDAQPASSRLFDLELHVRELGGAFQHKSGHVEPPHVRARLRLKLRELEAAAQELEATAERLSHADNSGACFND